MSKGLDELHTAAIMGNMYAESGVNPSAVESGGTGIGICQWSYGRANNLRRYAAQQGKSWDDLSVQLDFFWDHDEWSTEWSSTYTIRVHSVEGDPAVGEHVSGSKSGFLASTDLAEATKSFCYGWERPGIPRINVRLEAAQRYYTALTTGGTGGGQDYASAEQWQKNIVDCCHRVGWPGASLCATWTSRVYAAAGYSIHGNGNTQLGNQGGGAANYDPSRATTDLSTIKVGMLISAQYGSNSAAGNRYGHVGIYIGDGMVMDSVSTGIRTISLSDWVSQNNRGWVVCGTRGKAVDAERIDEMNKLKAFVGEHRKVALISLFFLIVFVGGSITSAVNVAQHRAQEATQTEQETQKKDSSIAEQNDVSLSDSQKKDIESYDDDTRAFIQTLSASICRQTADVVP